MSPQASIQDHPVYTWQDYRTWPDDERWEIIDGVAYAMAPAPSTRHQRVTGNVFFHLRQRLSGKDCTPFIAPTDVHLSDLDVVQPDCLVVCTPEQIRDTHIEGPPDLVVEVISPSTSAKDLRQKRRLYERSGVKEYLVLDPLEHYALLYRRHAGAFAEAGVFAADETLTLDSLDGLEIPLAEIFELPAPRAPRNPPPECAT